MMLMPGLGARLLGAASGGVAPAPVPAAGRAPDPAADQRYLRYGYRYVLDPSLVPPAEPAQKQLLVDISGLVERDARTGIQRVVRNLTRALARLDLPGWRVEPVYLQDG